MQLANLLTKQSRLDEVVKVLQPLLVEDITELDPFDGGRRIIWQPNPDYRHYACVQIAEAHIALKQYPEALLYARLARDKFTYQTFCGTGLTEYLQSLDDRVKKLEAITSIAGSQRRRP